MADVEAAELHEHAELLGEVYLSLVAHGWRLDASDLVRPGAQSVEDRILHALSDLHSERLVADDWGAQYRAAFRSVRAHLHTAAVRAGSDVLAAQQGSLTSLRRRLGQGTVPTRIRDVALRVRDRLGGAYSPSAEDETEATRIYGPRERPSTSVPDLLEKNPRFEGGLQAVYRRRVKAALAAELALYRKPADTVRIRPDQPARQDPRASRQEVVDLCKVLSVHPAFVHIFAAYAESADLGARAADRLVTEATEATAKLYVNLLTDPDLVWRYPPLVQLGVKRLGLDYVEGFPEYAVALAAVISEPWYKEPLTLLGFTIALVGILLAPPVAAGVAGAGATLGVAVADLAVTVTSGVLTFIEEREQDVAAVSGSFNETKLAEPPSYMETALAAAASVVCAIGVVFFGARAVKALRDARKTAAAVARHPPLDPIGNRLIASPQRRATSAAGNRLLRPAPARGVRRARFMDREVPPPQPSRAVRGGSRAQDKQLAATGSGGRGDMPPRDVSPGSQRQGQSTTGEAAGPVGGGSDTGQANVVPLPSPTPPGGSGVADSSFPMTPAQRQYGGSAVWKKAEAKVGAKLAKETRLPIEEQASRAALTLSVQGEAAPPITRRALLKEPIITDPAAPAPKWNKKRLEYDTPEASWKPDYVYLTPEQIEVFEVTLDSRFQVRPQERGIQFRGTEGPRGDPHKVKQLRNVEYLIKRYPHMPIVYNIQTIGQVPQETIDLIEAALSHIKSVQKKVGATGTFEVILRADTNQVFR